MASMNFALICCFGLFLVLCVSQMTVADEESSEEKQLQNLTAKLTVYMEGVKDTFSDMFRSLSDVIESEVQKNPETAKFLNSAKANITEAMQTLTAKYNDFKKTAAQNLP